MKTSDKVLVNFRVTPDMVTRIKRAAAFEDISQTALVKQAIKEKLDKLEKKMPQSAFRA